VAGDRVRGADLGVLLTMMFRSIAVPVKAAVMNLLSVGAYGVLTAVFQWGGASSCSGSTTRGRCPRATDPDVHHPVRLSMDYEVFLLSRVKEDYDRTRDPTAAWPAACLHQPRHHRRRRDHGDGVLRLRDRMDALIRMLGSAWGGHPARRHRRPDGAGAGHDELARPLELVAAGLARPGSAAARPRGPRVVAQDSPGRDPELDPVG
jgi:hypothetical protein